jgi:hypothetical protein
MTCVWFQVLPRPPCVYTWWSWKFLKLQGFYRSKLFSGESTKALLSDYLTVFRVCVHTFIWVHETVRHESVSGSFETPSCFRNVNTLHELVCVRKIVAPYVTFLTQHFGSRRNEVGSTVPGVPGKCLSAFSTRVHFLKKTIITCILSYPSLQESDIVSRFLNLFT